jgi:hypothetical protein
MFLRRSLILAIFCSFSFVGLHTLQGQTSDHTSVLLEERTEFAKDLSRIKKQILVNLTPAEAAIAIHVVIHVVDNGDVQFCQAETPTAEGELPIVVSQEFLRSLYMFTMAELIARARNQPDLADRYIAYVLKGFHKSIEDPQHPPRIESPQVWMNLVGSEKDRIVSESDKFWDLGMTFVLSHELAHQLYGDTRDGTTASQEVRLAREERADSWAIRHVLSMGLPPSACVFPLAYFGAFFVDLGDKAEHPAGACRSRAQLISTIENLDLLKDHSGNRNVDVAATREKLTADLNGMDQSEGGCPNGKAPGGTDVKPINGQISLAADSLNQAIRPLLRGEGQAQICAKKGKFLSRDGDEVRYDTQYKAPGWVSYVDIWRGLSGCMLYIEREFGSTKEAANAFAISKAFILRSISGCANKEDTKYDAELDCESVQTSLQYKGDEVTVVVSPDY